MCQSKVCQKMYSDEADTHPPPLPTTGAYTQTLHQTPRQADTLVDEQCSLHSWGGGGGGSSACASHSHWTWKSQI